MKTTTITEGKTKLEVPVLEKKQVPEQALVFFNPKMDKNRTNSINVTESYFKEKIKIADILSGLGARAVRYANELSIKHEIFANDIQPSAVELIKKNVKLNKVKINVSNKEANQFLVENKYNKFNFIDIDPFGSPAPFLNNTILAIQPKDSLIGITATDKGTLAGIYSKACFKKYGIIGKRTSFQHELGVRNLIAFTVKTAYLHDLTARPYFSYSHLHYNRIFIEMLGGGKETKRQLKNLGFIKYCEKCERRELISFTKEYDTKCECGFNAVILGTTWIGKLAEKPFFLEKSEIEITMPYYNISALTKIYKKESKQLKKVINELKEKGYKASRTHFDNYGLKTNAPYNEIINVIFKK